MKDVRLGKTDLIVSEVGFGGIPIIPIKFEDAVAVVRHCFEKGIILRNYYKYVWFLFLMIKIIFLGTSAQIPTSKRNHTSILLSYKEENIFNQNKQFDSLNLLHDVILEKINIITDKLKEETQIHLIETYTKVLVNCFDVLDKIQVQRDAI